MRKACHKTCHERLGSRINTSFACGFKSHRRHKNGNPRIYAGSPFFVVLCGFAGGASLHGCLQKCTDFCTFVVKACHETCHGIPRVGSNPLAVYNLAHFFQQQIILSLPHVRQSVKIHSPHDVVSLPTTSFTDIRIRHTHGMSKGHVIMP